MKTKLLNLLTILKENLKPMLTNLDSKFTSLIPNSMLRKILYYTVGGLFSLLFLIILIGILTLPFRGQSTNEQGFNLNKTITKSITDEKPKEMNETQKELLKLENNLKDLNFPESKLTIPGIKLEIVISE